MQPARPSNLALILILGALTIVSPFSIDMYLPAFPQIAAALGTDAAEISLSLSSYFIGLAVGQILYGPLLDRFGRKKPVYGGLSLYILASIGCLFVDTATQLIVLRFIQALGGCVAFVAAMAMVRDFFPVQEGAKVFSLLMLILGVSPLLAPTLGGFVTTWLGWHSVFIFLAAIVLAILLVTAFLLPESHAPDPTVSLRPLPMLRSFVEVFRVPQFHTYALAGSFSFAGLMVYVAGSPIIFMDVFGLSPQAYGGVFALLSVGFIGGNQLNVLLLRRYSGAQIFRAALLFQAALGIVFLTGTLLGLFGLIATTAFFFGYLSCLGLTFPNASAIALAPFARNAGTAAALIGFLQVGTGSLASAGVGLFNATDARAVVAILAATVLIGVGILLVGQRRIPQP